MTKSAIVERTNTTQEHSDVQQYNLSTQPQSVALVFWLIVRAHLHATASTVQTLKEQDLKFLLDTGNEGSMLGA